MISSSRNKLIRLKILSVFIYYTVCKIIVLILSCKFLTVVCKICMCQILWLIHNRHPFTIVMLSRVSLEVCDEVFCSEPAMIVVAVNGINDNPPTISVTPAGQVSAGPCLLTGCTLIYSFSHSLRETQWESMLLLQLTFQMLTVTTLWQLG